ncbi:tetratricopeptide repeat protein [Terasakiella pusilla]|uniref:tetratricopeptide repeat protein n=1 Tax=Terasakiella pusilla TaxID=64973 RepID=UPI003AA8637F
MSAFSSLGEQAQENERSVEGIDSEENKSPSPPAPISVSLSLAAAIRAHKKGKMEKAVQIYSGILRKYPDHADANYLLGVAAFERGLKDDAIAMIERAILSEPDNAAYYGKLGEILTLVGYVDRADEAYEKAAQLAPGDVRFHIGRAQILERSGDVKKALKQYLDIIDRWTESYEAYYRAAAIEARLGDRDIARKHVRQALSLKSDFADAHFLYALLVAASGKVQEATQHFEAASRFSADRADFHVKVANKLIQLNDYDGAMSALYREAKLHPHNADTYFLMGDCLSQRGEFDGAVLSYDRAIENNPSFALAYAQRGLALLALGRLADAHESCQKAVQIDGTDWQCLCALGVLLREDDHLNDAIDVLLKAVRLAPTEWKPLLEIALAYQDNLELDHAVHYIREAQSLNLKDKGIEFRLGQILLQAGRWEEGWPAYEARKKLATYKPLLSKAQCNAAVWSGQNLSDKRLVLFAEGSVSEAIQFIRFVPMVLERAKDVYIYCQKDLARLFSSIKGVSGVIHEGTNPPRCEFMASLNSLPLVLGVNSRKELPFFRPYLSADKGDVQQWQQRVSADSKGLSVGLVWQGSRSYRKDTRRSPGIWPFSRLFYMRGLDFFGLQVGDGSDVLDDPQLSKVVKNYGADLVDFADTAALIQCLDLVITCDSAVAHLAGAMGKRVWIVLPYAVDWRWGTPKGGAGVACHWYPSMTIYRQSEPGEWADVFARLGQELEELKLKNKG